MAPIVQPLQRKVILSMASYDTAVLTLHDLLHQHVRWATPVALTAFWNALEAFTTLPLTNSDHGVEHWARVADNAVRLAQGMGADPAVAVLFGALHDSARLNEFDDPEHGDRAADAWARRLHPWTALTDTQVEHLDRAIRDHSDGFLNGPTVVQACWDADRLDLRRVGIEPDPERLCSTLARRMLATQDDAWSLERRYAGPSGFSRPRRF